MLATYIQVKMRKFKAKIRQVYYFLCYQYAHILTHLLGNCRWIRGPIFHPIVHLNCTKYERNLRKTFCFLWGHRESPEPIRCKECGWSGMVKWLVHTYEYDGFDDVEPVDECPRCKEYL